MDLIESRCGIVRLQLDQPVHESRRLRKPLPSAQLFCPEINITAHQGQRDLAHFPVMQHIDIRIGRVRRAVLPRHQCFIQERVVLYRAAAHRDLHRDRQIAPAAAQMQRAEIPARMQPLRIDRIPHCGALRSVKIRAADHPCLRNEKVSLRRDLKLRVSPPAAGKPEEIQRHLLIPVLRQHRADCRELRNIFDGRLPPCRDEKFLHVGFPLRARGKAPPQVPGLHGVLLCRTSGIDVSIRRLRPCRHLVQRSALPAMLRAAAQSLLVEERTEPGVVEHLHGLTPVRFGQIDEVLQRRDGPLRRRQRLRLHMHDKRKPVFSLIGDNPELPPHLIPGCKMARVEAPGHLVTRSGEFRRPDLHQEVRGRYKPGDTDAACAIDRKCSLADRSGPHGLLHL